MDPITIIRRKRDGAVLNADEIGWLINNYQDGLVADYQMAAWAMAVTINGMTAEETYHLTAAMLDSGGRLSISADTPVVDKHSTGGVGDKVSLLLAPLLACFNVKVPMISGRGLGITGGTLDKLEGIPGFNTQLTTDQISKITNDIGCVITGATEDIAPADARLYSLRDVTGTVASIPLITASILSKKLAENLDALVLDVKCGSGSSMKTPQEANLLARSLIDTADRFGLRTAALITSMEQPLGNAIGNVVEVQEALSALHDGVPTDLLEVTTRLAFELLTLAGRPQHPDEIRQVLLAGATLERLEQMIAAQGGKLDQLPDTDWVTVASPTTGYLSAIRCDLLGHLLTEMGGGRASKHDSLDHTAGISLDISIGDSVNEGDIIAKISHPDPSRFSDVLLTTLEFSSTPVPVPPLILNTIH